MPTIDLTDRYYVAGYARPNPAAWTLDRRRLPARGAILHHTAGWYGRALGATATRDDEEGALDALARDHVARYGIGPAYHYAAFPSGRLYAVGKWGTHRAHTAGRNPDTLEYWNVEAIGIVAFGNYNDTPPPPGIVEAMRTAIVEARLVAGESFYVITHGDAARRAVNASRQRIGTATACPGQHLVAALGGPERPSVGAVDRLARARDELNAAIDAAIEALS